MAYDVAIIGGGIIGCAAAAYLAEAGQLVVLLERAELAAGASGRNSGVLQHPYDEPLGRLHRRSLELFRELAATDTGFEVGPQPAGLLLVTHDEEELATAAAALGNEFPELAPQVLASAELRALEPGLDEGVAACRLDTGYPVMPAAATLSFARRAERAGAIVRTGAVARPLIGNGIVEGVQLADGERIAAQRILVAAGPWAPAIVPGWAAAPPISSTFGVVVATRLAEPPRNVLEEMGIDPGGAGTPSAFSLVTAGGTSSVGSTFLPSAPDPAAIAPMLLARGARYVRALADAAIVSVRVCARPISFDGRPLIGPLAGMDGLFVCAGHGPWGLSTGPASAELVAQLMLGGAADDDALAAGLGADRWPADQRGGKAGQRGGKASQAR